MRINMKITWHKFSYPDFMPPLDVGILITDGKIVTVAMIVKLWRDKPVTNLCGLDMSGYGFCGYEWEYDFDITKITHWALLPDMPNKKTL